jgi:hypothetical protein
MSIGGVLLDEKSVSPCGTEGGERLRRKQRRPERAEKPAAIIPPQAEVGARAGAGSGAFLNCYARKRPNKRKLLCISVNMRQYASINAN